MITRITTIAANAPCCTYLVPVVGAVVTEVAVVHAPGVEPLELSVLIVLVEIVAVLLLTPVNISGLRGKPVSLCLKLIFKFIYLALLTCRRKHKQTRCQPP